MIDFGEFAKYVDKCVSWDDWLAGIVGMRLRVLVEYVVKFQLYIRYRLPVSAIICLELGQNCVINDTQGPTMVSGKERDGRQRRGWD